MSIFETIQLIVATAVLLLSLFASQLRAAFWVVVIVLDLILSTQWWVSGLPYGDVVTAVSDFTLCILIWVFARYRWEFWLFLLYQASMLTSIVDFGAGIFAPGWISHDSYSSILEAINYLSFVVIGGVSGYAFNDRFDSAAFDPWIRVLSFDGARWPFGAKDKR